MNITHGHYYPIIHIKIRTPCGQKYFFGWLVSNKERQVWNLLKATGSDHDVSGGLTPLLGPVWQGSSLPWADPRAAALASLPPVGRAFHFGRLGFYKRSAQGLRQGHGQGQGTVSSASLNAGTVGASLGLACPLKSDPP